MILNSVKLALAYITSIASHPKSSMHNWFQCLMSQIAQLHKELMSNSKKVYIGFHCKWDNTIRILWELRINGTLNSAKTMYELSGVAHTVYGLGHYSRDCSGIRIGSLS